MRDGSNRDYFSQNIDDEVFGDGGSDNDVYKTGDNEDDGGERKNKDRRNEDGGGDKKELNAFVSYNRYNNYDMSKVRQKQRNYDRLFKNRMMGEKSKGYTRRKDGWRDGEDGGSGIRTEQTRMQKYRERYDRNPMRNVNYNLKETRKMGYKKGIYALYSSEGDDDEDGRDDGN